MMSSLSVFLLILLLIFTASAQVALSLPLSSLKCRFTGLKGKLYIWIRVYIYIDEAKLQDSVAETEREESSGSKDLGRRSKVCLIFLLEDLEEIYERCCFDELSWLET